MWSARDDALSDPTITSSPFPQALSDLTLSTFQLPVVVACLLNKREYPVPGVFGGILCNISGVMYYCVRQSSKWCGVLLFSLPQQLRSLPRDCLSHDPYPTYYKLSLSLPLSPSVSLPFSVLGIILRGVFNSNRPISGTTVSAKIQDNTHLPTLNNCHSDKLDVELLLHPHTLLLRDKALSDPTITSSPFPQALSDLTLSTFQLPVVVACLLNKREYPVPGVFGGILCNISGVMYYCVRQVSFFAVCSIAIDRFLALRFPLKYKTILTYQRSIIVTVISWTLSFFSTLIPFFYGTKYVYNNMFIYCMWDILNTPALFIYVDIIFFPTFLISNAILASTSVINIIKLHQLAAKGRQQNLGNTASLERASRTALIVVLAFTICYTPRYAQVFFKTGRDEPEAMFYFRSLSEMLIYLNSAVNPLIYIFRSRQYIAEISAIFGPSVQGFVVSVNGNGATGAAVSRYHSLPLGNLAGKTADLMSVPRSVLDKASVNSGRHSRLEPTDEDEDSDSV
eukprot:sb/3463958/